MAVGVEDNKALVLRFYEEVWNRGHVDVALELFADDYVRHDLRPTKAGAGGAGMAEIARAFREAFPDLSMQVDLVVAEGDLVAARWTASGTFTGRWGDLSPTRKPATFSGVNIFRIRDGRVVELWNHRDDLSLMQQVGAAVFAGSARDPEGPTADARAPARPTTRAPVVEPLLLLPGILMPAALRYGSLIERLGDDAQAILKDLEVYATSPPPPVGYSFDSEIEAVDRAADEAGFDRFHLYGHSGGGAVALAYVAARPHRVRSLAVDEPASDFSQESRDAIVSEVRVLDEYSPEQAMAAFARRLLRDEAPDPLPPPDPAPPWMADRPAGLRAFAAALRRHFIDPQLFRSFRGPVYYSYGSLSNERWEAMANRLADLFRVIKIERYEGLHHLNTSHVAQPDRVASALRDLWARVG